MSEQAIEQPVVETPVVEEVIQTPYAKELESLPESVRPLVEPIFKEWDGKTTQKFQELHSQYDPWKNVISSSDPDTVSQLMQLADMLENNPKDLYDYLGSFYKFGEQGPPGTTIEQPVVDELPEGVNAELLQHPEFVALQQAVQNMAQIIVNGQQEQTAQQQQAELDQVLGGLKEKHGDYDTRGVLQFIAEGLDPDAAVEAWKTSVTSGMQLLGMSQQQPNAPVVVSANGGGTQSLVDGGKRPGELTQRETSDIVVGILERANAASK